jgi:hypothetical protein
VPDALLTKRARLLVGSFLVVLLASGIALAIYLPGQGRRSASPPERRVSLAYNLVGEFSACTGTGCVPLSGNLDFTPTDSLGKVVHVLVGDFGLFWTHLRPGRWSVFGRSPHWQPAAQNCSAGPIVVPARGRASVQITCTPAATYGVTIRGMVAVVGGPTASDAGPFRVAGSAVEATNVGSGSSVWVETSSSGGFAFRVVPGKYLVRSACGNSRINVTTSKISHLQFVCAAG